MNDEIDKRLKEKLLREAGPTIAAALQEPGVIEIALNPDGKLWIEKLGEGFVQRGSMSPQAAESFMCTIASCLQTSVTRETPILEGELPIDGSRFEGLLPPVVANPTFTIRRKASKVFSLQDYVESGIITQAQKDAILAAVDHRLNILVVGGTGTGKTTLTNAIIDAIATRFPDHRIVYMEDTAELQCSAPNAVALHTTSKIDMQVLLKVTMRLRPDRILVGETRGAECLDLLKAWNTGHPGGVATIHANDGVGGLLRVAQLVAEASKTPMPEVIAQAVNLVVVIKKDPVAGRKISELLRITGHDGRAYTFERL